MENTFNMPVTASDVVPKSIATAIWAITSEVEEITREGQGAGFKTTRIQDVLKHIKPLLKTHGLAIKPVETSSELADLTTYNSSGAAQKTTFYVGKFKFRLVSKGGDSWIDHEDERTQHVLMKMDGTAAAACQSMALKSFILGLFEIPTADPEADEADGPGFSKGAAAKKKTAAPAEKDKPYLVNEVAMDADEVFDFASLEVAPKGMAEISAFLDVYADVLAAMNKADKPVWLRIQKMFDHALKSEEAFL